LAHRKVQHGVAREVTDHRDQHYTPPHPGGMKFPRAVDLRPAEWPVWEQGGLNSCTAQAICAAYQLMLIRERVPKAYDPSRLFLYYNERAIEGKVDDNAPVYMRDGMKTVRRTGVCAEAQWPYVEKRYAERPPEPCFTAAQEHRAVSYLKVKQDLKHIKHCLAEGYPVTIALVLYYSDDRQALPLDGNLLVPDPAKETPCGGHAMLLVGYDDARERFLVRNSHGGTWGQKGYGTLPYAYALNPDWADSLWTIRRAS